MSGYIEVPREYSKRFNLDLFKNTNKSYSIHQAKKICDTDTDFYHKNDATHKMAVN